MSKSSFGVSCDPQLGLELLFGSGGVMVEVYNDVALRRCPIGRHLGCLPNMIQPPLLGVVKERLHREAMERVRMQRLADARQFIEDQSFDHAIRTLEAAIRESGDDEEVRALMGRARTTQAEAVQSALTQAEQETVLPRRPPRLATVGPR